jgi:hypothetical protein
MSEAPATPATPAPLSTVATFKFEHLDGERSFDCAEIPGTVRLDFLFGAVRTYIANRLNGMRTRHEKDPKVIAWKAYDEATKADPLQSAVPKPEGERPGEPDYEDAFNRAVNDLKAGNIRRQSDEPKPRKTKDPLVAVVTDAVVRDVYTSKRAEDAKYSYLSAKKEVGTDGVAYLKSMIETRVAAVADAEKAALRAALEKQLETRYIGPAKVMLGMNTPKAATGLPSIL